MKFLLKPNYQRVLSAMRDGKLRTSPEICAECGLDQLDCTGAISILRRVSALDQTGKNQYIITDVGRKLLEEAPAIGSRFVVQVERRSSQ